MADIFVHARLTSCTDSPTNQNHFVRCLPYLSFLFYCDLLDNFISGLLYFAKQKNVTFGRLRDHLSTSKKHLRDILFSFLLFASFLSSRQEDISHSFHCASSNKEETGRARPPLVSLAQTLVVNGKC